MTRTLFITLALLGFVESTGEAQYAGRDPSECALMSTAEVEVIPYEIQPRDRCTRIARRHFGDRRRYDLIHEYNPDLGPTPHHFRPGTFICLPRVATPAAAAQITALRDNVRRRAGERANWTSASLGQELDRGTHVNTLEDAYAELTFADRTVITLRNDTLVVVYGSANNTERRSGTEAVLERGSLRTRLTGLRRGERFSVRTPSSRVALGEGGAVTSVDEAATTRVSNHTGSAAEVSGRSGSAVRVPAGMGSKIRRNRRPTPPRPLPPAPAWLAQPSRFIGTPTFTRISGGWSPVEVARVYQVEAVRVDGENEQLVARVEVPSSVTRFEMHRLPPGAYRVRVSSIDEDFFESAPSDAWDVSIDVVGVAAPDGEEADESFDAGDPSLEAPAQAEVLLGQRLIFPEGTRCGVGDERASELVLRELGSLQLVCDGQPAIAMAPLRVVGTLMQVEDAELIIGETQQILVRLETNANHPGAEFVGEGVEIVEVERVDEGYRLTVQARDEATNPATLTWRDGEVVLAQAEIPVAAPTALAAPEELPPEPTPEAPDGPWTQVVGTLGLPNHAALRDNGRDGVYGWLGATVEFEESARVRGTLGVHAAILQRQLQLEAGVAYDFSGTTVAARGSGDVFATLGYRPKLDSFDFVLDLSAYFPAGPDGLGSVRLIPSAHLGVTIADRVRLRMRQGAAIRTRESDTLTTWISAYGVEARVAGGFNAGVEFDLAYGERGATQRILPSLAASVSYAMDFVIINAAFRLPFGDDAQAYLGDYAFMLSVEAGTWSR